MRLMPNPYPMKNKLLFLPLFLFILSAHSQVIVNSETNVSLLNSDSIWRTMKSKKTLVRINYQTGETTLKVSLNTFAVDDTLWQPFLSQSKTEFYLTFNVNRETLNLLTKDNKIYTFEVPGMLFFNDHFHSVTVKHSFYNKNGNTADLANNKIFASISCSFNPFDFQLDWPTLNTKESVLFWLNKQAINFYNVE